MPDYIVFHAATPAEVHQCAYALIRHLDIYNRKPPASQHVVVYTSAPAQLEAYGTFFSRFDLEEISPERPASDCLRRFCATHQGPVLFIGCYCYPVSELEPMFDEIRAGRIYADNRDPSGVTVLGFQASGEGSARAAMQAPYRTANGYLGHYNGLKEFAQLMQLFFQRYQEESVPNQVKLMHPLDAATILQQKNDFLRLPLATRLVRKITGKGWKISNYLKKD